MPDNNNQPQNNQKLQSEEELDRIYEDASRRNRQDSLKVRFIGVSVGLILLGSVASTVISLANMDNVSPGTDSVNKPQVTNPVQPPKAPRL